MPIPEDSSAPSPPQLNLREAFRIAVHVHGDQVDKAGEPYLFHVIRVAMAMETDEERVVAILHDVVEDTPGPMMSASGYLPTEKFKMLMHIKDAYGVQIAESVYALTKMEGEPYECYLARLSQNPLAVKVKLADLAENSNPTRLAKLPVDVRQRLEAKYTAALEFLTPKPKEPTNEAPPTDHYLRYSLSRIPDEPRTRPTAVPYELANPKPPADPE